MGVNLSPSHQTAKLEVREKGVIKPDPHEDNARSAPWD